MQTQLHRWREAKSIWRYLFCAGLIAFALAIYFYRVPADPPGFYIDESSIAYNAYTISQSGRDESGVAWPLYFQAFGEFKNPTLIYLLALVFKATGPSMFVARALCALLGVTAALLLAVLAWKISGQFMSGMIVGLSATLTPWLYESSRLVFEAAAYPLIVVAFLLALSRATVRVAWRAGDVVLIAVTLALLTYSYSIGRLLGPLLALGLILFAGKGNRRAVASTLAAYAVTLLPMMVFAFRHPGALSARFKTISYLGANESAFAKVWQFFLHYLQDINPWTMLVLGENNPRDHTSGMGSVLLVTFVIAVAGLAIVITTLRRDAWWRFIVYALFVSVVPAALTVNEFPQLRLVAFPVFLHVLMVPALKRLSSGANAKDSAHSIAAKGRLQPSLLVATVALIVLQGLYFQFLFHRESPSRWYFMDARFARKVLTPALALHRDRIYLFDPPGESGYIQSLWHGLLTDVDAGRFVRADRRELIPADSVVISTERTCDSCRLLARSLNYIVYVVLPSNAEPKVAALPREAFRAQIALRHTPKILQTGSGETLRVTVKNTSDAPWSCVGDSQGRHAVVVRARWLIPDGTFLSDAGRTELNYDLEPGDVNDVDLPVTSPPLGASLLEIDLVQEPNNWFSQNGSQPLRLPMQSLSRN
ncbi:MAG TPA: hypothetical protein VFX97_07305 [Pyrinomonadaceae bacterium]|nr:hypothetical protein [Pyrinomonadaceae bacterium]